MSIIPAHFNYTKTFVSREHHFLENGKWRRSTSDGDEPLHDQINRWVDEEKVQLTLVSAPSIQVLHDAADHREYLLVMAVMYIPPTEGDEDVLQRASDTGDDPRPALESERDDVRGVSEPFGAQESPQAESE